MNTFIQHEQGDQEDEHDDRPRTGANETVHREAV